MPAPRFEFDRSLVWFRRDLRIDDHAALCQALRTSRAVHCVFVFDTAILDVLPRRDRRVEFIHRSVTELDAMLRESGGGLIVLHGDARDEIPQLAQSLGVDAVFANEDYEPAAVERDKLVAARLHVTGRRLLQFRDHVIFGPGEILTQAGTPYSVFTPYKRAWLAKLVAHPDALALWPCEPAGRLAPGARCAADSRKSGCGNLAVRTGLARLLLHDPASPSTRRRSRIQAAV
jgi:deoxyribodipyrimidine photo-lyase